MKAARTKISNLVAKNTLVDSTTKKTSQQLAAYLLDENRVSELDSILRDVQQVWAENGYVNVIATSAYTLNESAKKDIKNKVKTIYPAAKNIVISEQIDPNIIAGVRLNLPNQQLDLSIESKLNRFRTLTLKGKG